LIILAISCKIKENRRKRKMIVNSTEIQNNFGRYLDLADNEEVVITKNGSPVARLVGMKKTISFLSDRLVGLIPKDINEAAEKSERLGRK
jgi:prevent-host-death family protein